MCISLTTLALIGTAVQVVGAVYQASQQSKAYEAQANQARQHGEIKAQEAERSRLYALRTAEEEDAAARERADKIRRAGAKEASRAKASLAASGVASDTGSAVLIQEYIGASAESDAFAETITGSRKARAYTERADAYGRQATYARQGSLDEANYLDMAANNALTAGLTKASTSLLQGYRSYRYGPGPTTRPGWIAAQSNDSWDVLPAAGDWSRW